MVYKSLYKNYALENQYVFKINVYLYLYIIYKENTESP